ncbi:helitron_like_N domain-containing protein [Trichonephila clavipes]|nr:helitron_like_N domain-containing protein [Trichonephila clavipes]
MYLIAAVIKSVVKAWLQFLLGQSFSKHSKITVHWDSFNANTITTCVAANGICDDPIEHLQCGRSALASEVLLERQNLAISETWMEDSMPVNVPGFDLRSSNNNTKLRQIAASSSVAVSSSSRKDVGVAIHRSINSFTDCNRVNLDISEINLGMKDPKAVVTSI